MATYNMESQFLDLKKTYQEFDYEPLQTQLHSKQEAEQAGLHEGLTQNTYLYAQEKRTLLADAKSMAIYFTHKYVPQLLQPSPSQQSLLPLINPTAFAAFPFERVMERICFIVQKYQQQPTLLDGVLGPMITDLMEAVSKWLSDWNTKVVDRKRSKEDSSQSEGIPTIPAELHLILLTLSHLTKVRSPAATLPYFPHQVKDLYPAMTFLLACNDEQHWESRYVILLWVGVIVMVPFGLEIIDQELWRGGQGTTKGAAVIQYLNLTQAVDQKGPSNLMVLLLQIGIDGLYSLSKIKQAAAELLGCLFTRPDVQKSGLLGTFIHFCLQVLRQSPPSIEPKKEATQQQAPPGVISAKPTFDKDIHFISGVYHALTQIFKRVSRKQLLSLIEPVLVAVGTDRNCQDSLRKELRMRLLMRIGLCYLRPRVAVWAFKTTKESLKKNLSLAASTRKVYSNVGSKNNHVQAVDSGSTKQAAQKDKATQSDRDYYTDVNKRSLESIIDMLMDGLSEKETLVREAASQALGTIAGRLGPDMVEDILDYMLHELPPSPQLQHSLCLTVAQLIRRNLVSPARLQTLYTTMKEALLYEQEQGGYSVGQAVRDAACYMVWSVARGYERGGNELGVTLMIAACFDRQVGCRRAAAAAYQELVGRVGDVPNGIEILSEADYFTLGLQKNAYLNVAVFVASHEAYFGSFIEHLCFQKLRHWDLEIKRIAACSLSLMSSLNGPYMTGELLPSLISLSKSDVGHVKLGAIIGLGQLVLGLSGWSHLHQLHNEMKDSVFLKSLTQNEKKLLNAGEYMNAFKAKFQLSRHQSVISLIAPETINNLLAVVFSLMSETKLYRGKIGETYRIYVCRLLECLALSQIELPPQVKASSLAFIEASIKNPLENIHMAAVKSLEPFMAQYYDETTDAKFIQDMLYNAKSNTPFSKCSVLALGKLGPKVYARHAPTILDTLKAFCEIKKENNDPERRKFAIQGLQSIACLLCKSLAPEQLQGIFNCFFGGLRDYTMDKRGDIGSIVREGSMQAMLRVLRAVGKAGMSIILSQQVCQTILNLLLQQLCEKIDRVRLLAGSLLQQFFDELAPLYPRVAQADRLQAIFGQKAIKKMVQRAQQRTDSHLETQVIRLEMQLQEQCFGGEGERYLIYSWNLPHLVFPVITPLLESPAYSLAILRGLVTSAGGISQSIVKWSQQELGGYISHIDGQSVQDKQRLFNQFFGDALQLMKEHFRQQRIIVPLYKTLDFILEREEILSWPGIKAKAIQIYFAIEKQLGGSYNSEREGTNNEAPPKAGPVLAVRHRSMNKLCACAGLYVSLLFLNALETKDSLLRNIVGLLCSDLPKARKLLADKFILYLMMGTGDESEDNASDGTQRYPFTLDQVAQLTEILGEYDFIDQKLDCNEVRHRLEAVLSLKK